MQDRKKTYHTNNFINPNPKCEKECRFSTGLMMTTAMAWMPEYDKYGKLLNSNPNIRTTDMSCSECGKQWTITQQSEKTTIEEKNHG